MLKNFKKKGRVQHLPDSSLYTSLEQRVPGENMKYKSFQPTLWLSSAVNVDPMPTADERLKAPYISSFHWAFFAAVMFTDVSQINLILFPSF